MKIGIDIDDVITDTSTELRNYILKYDTSGEVKKYIEEILRGEIPTENIKKFLGKYTISIFEKVKVKENSQNVINRLLKAGHEIIIITSRGEVRYKDSEKITLKYLKENNINYTKILFNSFKKDEICIENNINLLVDDSVKLCNDASQKGINSIVFNSQINKNVETNLVRVNNWLELEQEINKLK